MLADRAGLARTKNRQRQRRTEGDARPQKEGGIPEAVMIAKVSPLARRPNLSGTSKGAGPGELRQHINLKSGCPFGGGVPGGLEV